MAISDKEYDENDPKTRQKLEFLRELNKKTADKLTCWQDMYDELGRLARIYTEMPSKEHADFVIITLWSFVIAMELLPDEGDISAIARKMNEILVMRDDLHGATVFVGEEADQKRAEAQLMTAALISRLMGEISAKEQEADPTPVDKRKLH